MDKPIFLRRGRCFEDRHPRIINFAEPQSRPAALQFETGVHEIRVLFGHSQAGRFEISGGEQFFRRAKVLRPRERDKLFA
ncbi:MAG TPA: hypothetical protein VMT58_01940 [Candidatus Binataceae bacterium]|nr:hypothetical protein [Candidatus Binataceae bacterium]